MCGLGCLSSEFVKGKIVVCRGDGAAALEAFTAGAIGSVIYNIVEESFSTITIMPYACIKLKY